MESITKRKLGSQEIATLVKRAFGDNMMASNAVELEEGWFNTIYLIRLSDGREVVLKVAPSHDVRILRYEKNIMKTEVEVMRLLASKADIPVPRVYFYDASGAVIENEYFFMEKVSGREYSKVKAEMSERQRDAVEIELGRYNRIINDIKGTEFGFFAQKEGLSSNWPNAFMNMLRAVLQDGKEYDVKLPKTYEEIEELFTARLSVFDSVVEASLVHWDLHDGNIFVNDEGKITGIIDFERCLWGDPLMELYFGDFYDKSSFCRGYGNMELNTENAKCRRILYNIYLYLIMVIECKYRNFQDQEHIKWTYTMLESEINKLLSV